jgi:hypothetical protein
VRWSGRRWGDDSVAEPEPSRSRGGLPPGPTGHGRAVPLLRSRVTRLTVVLSLLGSACLAACSDDDPPVDPSPTTSSSSASVPDDDPSSTAPSGSEAAQSTDPCDLFDRSEYDDAVAARDRPFLAARPVLGSGDEPFLMCEVTTNGEAFFSFGYALSEGAYDRVRRSSQEQYEVRNLADVGDRAFYLDTSVFPTAYAAVGEQTVAFAYSLLRTDRSALRGPLLDLVATAEEQGITVGPPLATGPGCPDPTGEEVRAVLGAVAFARGVPDEHGVPQCQYRSGPRRHTMLTTSATYYSKVRFAQEQAGGVFAAGGADLDVDDDSEVIDAPPGRTERVSGDPTSGFTVRTTYPRQRIYASVSIDPIGYAYSVAGSRRTLRRVAALWWDAAEPVIEAYRPAG